MGSIPSATFSGVSKYASDFQQVLNRAVAIAALPLQQLQNNENDLTQQQTAISGLQTTFESLQTAIQNLGTAAQGAVSATASDTSLIQPTASSTTLPGTYTVDVRSLGSFTNTLSKAGLTTVTDANSGGITSSTAFTLTVNGTAHAITTSANTLNALASAINSAAVGVQATIVNIGSNSAPDYRLSLASNNLAADTIQLNDGTQDLLDTLSTGSPATYRINGSLTDIHSNSRQITLAPGLTANLLQASPGNPVTITVAQGTGALASNLSSLAGAYNSAVDALAQQHGKNAGALAGSSLVLALQQSLRSITQYGSGSGSIGSVSDIGLNLDSTGHLSFDATKLNSQNLTAVQQFLGSTTSSGFLKTATDAITTVADTTSGLIHGSLTVVQDRITNQSDLISKETDRITQIQERLQQQLAAADAAIAVLQQQVTFLASLFASQYPGAGSSNIGNSNNKN